jgi:hypothetical protein
MIEKINEILIIYWIWIDYTFSITIEKFDSCDFTKKFGQVFHVNKHKCVEKNILLKNYFHLKDNKSYVGGLHIKINFICLSKC